MKEEKDRTKEFDDAIRILLKTTEELKSKLPPLIMGQKDIHKILESQGKAIDNVIDELMGTVEDHKKALEKLDLLQIRVSKLEESSIENYRELIISLKKRLENLEFRQVKKIVTKIIKKQTSITDLENIDELLCLQPDDVYLLSIKAEVLFGIGRKEDAVEFLDKAISKHPKGARLWYVKGKILDDVDERLKCLEIALDLLKDGSALSRHIVLYSQAYILLSVNRLEEALESANESIKNIPDCEGAWLLKGTILMKLNRIPEALGCFDKTTEINEKSKAGWFNKGIVLSALGKKHYRDALECFNKSIEIDPKFALGYFNKAKILIDMDQDEEAIKIIDLGLEIDDNEACAWCDRGAALNRLGQNPEALESLERAIKLGPPKECIQVFQNLGIVLYYSGHFRRGLELFEKLTNDKPKNAISWNMLGCFLQKLNRDEDALCAFETALELRKTDEDIDWDDLAKVYERMGMKKEAEDADKRFKDIRKKPPDNE